MACLLVFMKRAPKEVEVFGGEVYVDVDGKNVATVRAENVKCSVTAGRHKIKMYKSHNYGTFIGMSEAIVELKDNDSLLVKYSPPLLVSQPGNMVVTDYVDDDQTDALVRASEMAIATEVEGKQRSIREQEDKRRNGMIIFIAIAVASAILSGIFIAAAANPW